MAYPFGRPAQGLFRNVIGPWAKKMFQGGRAGAGRGFASIKSNVGYGFSALKGDPKTVLGASGLESMGRRLSALRPGRVQSAGKGGPFGYYSGNLREIGGGVLRDFGRWSSASDLAGQGKLRGVAIASRQVAPTAGLLGLKAGTDFLNPWGLGWGD